MRTIRPSSVHRPSDASRAARASRSTPSVRSACCFPRFARLAAGLLVAAVLVALAPAGPFGAFAPVARAADEPAKPTPAYRAAMKRFLLAQNIPAQLAEQMTFSAAEQVLGNLASSGVTITEPMQMVAVDEARKAFGKRFGDVEYLTDLSVDLYAKHFSEKELVEIATFWESPLAKKLLARTDTINEAFMLKLQETVEPMSSELQTRVDQRLRAEGALGAAP